MQNCGFGSKFSGQNCFFSWEGGGQFFVTRESRSRLSTRAKATIDPTCLIIRGPRPINCERVSEQPVNIFPIYHSFMHHRIPYLLYLLYLGSYWLVVVVPTSHDLHPKRSPPPGFHALRIIFRARRGGKKSASSSWRLVVSLYTVVL